MLRFISNRPIVAPGLAATALPVASAVSLLLSLAIGSALAVDWDTYSDTWVATDGLGRALPTYDDVGPPNPNKSVGIYYYLWLGGTAGAIYRSKVYDITRILAANPTNPDWGPRWAFHHWGQPLFDYYRSDDRYVLRKHAQMLADAGVDALFFDVTNGDTYDSARQALCEEFEAFRVSGHQIPKLSFLAHTDEGTTVRHLYDSMYAPNAYPGLWFKWANRPLVLAKPANMDATVRAFFTLRESWAWTDATGWFGNGRDKWPWLDDCPQDYGWHSSSSVPEEISVCVAQHPTSIGAPHMGNIGRSFHNGNQPPASQYHSGAGLCFAEQWQRALAVSSEMTFITGWNEWIAQRFVAGLDGNPLFLGSPTIDGQSYFVDEYSQEISRDVEPMASGHGDNYYYQMVGNIRRLKGVRPISRVQSGAVTVDGAFADWAHVQPEFRDQIGDTARRNHPGYDPAVTLVNGSGRNDMVVAKVSQDETSICFYVRTRDTLTSPAAH